MPNRILKESVCTSESINALDWKAEVLFYRLMVSCDDYGRFDGRIAILKNRLFPLKEDLTKKEVESSLAKLVSAGLVALYEVDGKPFLYLPTWDDHQSVRAKKSKFPSPDDGVIISESICKQMKSNASKCPRNPIQSESESNPNPIRDYEADFDRFWEVYPKKDSKTAARKAFVKVKVPVDTLISAVQRQKQLPQWKKDGGQYIPNPATWLNQERWEDQGVVESENKPSEWQLGILERMAIDSMMSTPADDDLPFYTDKEA